MHEGEQRVKDSEAAREEDVLPSEGHVEPQHAEHEAHHHRESRFCDKRDAGEHCEIDGLAIAHDRRVERAVHATVQYHDDEQDPHDRRRAQDARLLLIVIWKLGVRCFVQRPPAWLRFRLLGRNQQHASDAVQNSADGHAGDGRDGRREGYDASRPHHEGDVLEDALVGVGRRECRCALSQLSRPDEERPARPHERLRVGQEAHEGRCDIVEPERQSQLGCRKHEGEAGHGDAGGFGHDGALAALVDAFRNARGDEEHAYGYKRGDARRLKRACPSQRQHRDGADGGRIREQAHEQRAEIEAVRCARAQNRCVHFGVKDGHVHPVSAKDHRL